MKVYNYYIGVDVAKDTLDICISQGKEKQYTLRVSNDTQGLNTLRKQLKQWNVTPEKTLLCLENTGFYGHLLAHWAVTHQYKTWIADALSIKKSLGLVRGKNDHVDAHRIALYAYRFRDQQRLWQPSSGALYDLQQLFTTRNRLLRTLNQLKTPLQESARFLPKTTRKPLQNCCNPALRGIEKSLKLAEEQIKEHIQQHTELAAMNRLITAIDGVGPQLAIGFIVASYGFEKLRSARAMACYAGVAPFEHTSGSSIRGRSRVSPLANKSLKCLLHMSALSAIRHNEELKAYYERKIASGKPKMSVINAVRNKLIARIFACIRDGRKYEKNYTRKVA